MGGARVEVSAPDPSRTSSIQDDVVLRRLVALPDDVGLRRLVALQDDAGVRGRLALLTGASDHI